MIERIRSGGGAQRMRTDFKAQGEGIASDQLVDAVWCNRLIQLSGPVVTDRSKQRPFAVGCVPRLIQIIVEQCMTPRVPWDVAGLVAFAVDPQVRYAAAWIETLMLYLRVVLKTKS